MLIKADGEANEREGAEAEAEAESGTERIEGRAAGAEIVDTEEKGEETEAGAVAAVRVGAEAGIDDAQGEAESEATAESAEVINESAEGGADLHLERVEGSIGTIETMHSETISRLIVPLHLHHQHIHRFHLPACLQPTWPISWPSIQHSSNSNRASHEQQDLRRRSFFGAARKPKQPYVSTFFSTLLGASLSLMSGYYDGSHLGQCGSGRRSAQGEVPQVDGRQKAGERRSVAIDR